MAIKTTTAVRTIVLERRTGSRLTRAESGLAFIPFPGYELLNKLSKFHVLIEVCRFSKIGCRPQPVDRIPVGI